MVAKGGPRDARQVLANGGVFGALAAGAVLAPDPRWWVLGAATLAAAAADTWATEIGTLIGRVPRSILDGRPVAPGMSGGVTWPGTLGGGMGALAVAATGALLAPLPMLVVGGAGVAGGVVDSLLGATLQGRRWCASCERGTERRVHGCGAITEARGGVAWVDNDLVNLLATAAGAATAALWLLVVPSPAPAG